MQRLIKLKGEPLRGGTADRAAGLQDLAIALEEARRVLERHANGLPALRPSIRALRRLGQRAKRPMRVAILGESNSGKSTLANALMQTQTLPASVVTHTRLPTLLRYCPSPSVMARYTNGGSLPLTPGIALPAGSILRIEVGLPLESLQGFEFLDFPGSSDPLFPVDLANVARNGADAAIWTTVATQAWRDTERALWSELPSRIMRRGLLVVTQCDLIACNDDREKLENRLNAVAADHFSGIHTSGRALGKDVWPGLQDLIEALTRLKNGFENDRLEKALRITRQIAARTLGRIAED